MRPNFIYSLGRKINTYYNKLCQDVLSKHNLSQTDFDIIMFLNNNPAFHTAKDIVDYRGIKKNVVSMHVDDLVNNGYLTRTSLSDKRKIKLECTSKCNEIIKEGLKIQDNFYKVITHGIDDNDIKVVEEFFKNIDMNLKGVK